eukprot:g264.t1
MSATADTKAESDRGAVCPPPSPASRSRVVHDEREVGEDSAADAAEDSLEKLDDTKDESMCGGGGAGGGAGAGAGATPATTPTKPWTKRPKVLAQKELTTECGHTVRISRVEGPRINGGRKREQFRALVSGPKFDNNSGVRSLYTEPSYEQVKEKLEHFFKLKLPMPYTNEIGAKIRRQLREVSPEIDDIHTACGHTLRISKQEPGLDGQFKFMISGPRVRNNSGIRCFYASPSFAEVDDKLRGHMAIRVDKGYDVRAGNKIRQRMRELCPEIDDIVTSCGHTLRIHKVKKDECRFVISGPRITNNAGVRSIHAKPTLEDIQQKLQQHVHITVDTGFEDVTGRKIRQRMRELFPEIDDIVTSCGHTVRISKTETQEPCRFLVSGPSIRNNSGLRSFFTKLRLDEIQQKLQQHVHITVDTGFEDVTGRKIRQRLRELFPKEMRELDEKEKELELVQMRKLIRGDDAEADSWHNMLSQRPTGSSPLAASDSDGESTSASASKSTAAEDGDAGISAGVGAGVRAGDPFGNYFALVGMVPSPPAFSAAHSPSPRREVEGGVGGSNPRTKRMHSHRRFRSPSADEGGSSGGGGGGGKPIEYKVTPPSKPKPKRAGEKGIDVEAWWKWAREQGKPISDEDADGKKGIDVEAWRSTGGSGGSGSSWIGNSDSSSGIENSSAQKITTACGHTVQISKVEVRDQLMCGVGECRFEISGPRIRTDSGVRCFYTPANLSEVQQKLEDAAGIKVDAHYEDATGQKIQQRMSELFPEKLRTGEPSPMQDEPGSPDILQIRKQILGRQDAYADSWHKKTAEEEDLKNLRKHIHGRDAHADRWHKKTADEADLKKIRKQIHGRQDEADPWHASFAHTSWEFQQAQQAAAASRSPPLPDVG